MADAKKARKEAEKAAKRAKRAARKQQYSQLWQAFKMLRKQDKALVPYMLLALVGIAALFFLIGMIFHFQWIMLILGIIIGATVAMVIFSRRMERSVYAQADGQPGAAGWAVENMRSGPGIAWKAKTAVATTTQMDAVHRVVGLPGVILVAEGEERRVRPLLAQQRKRLARLIPDTPIYDVITGTDEEAGQVPLKKLQRHLMKLPRNLSKNEVYALADRLDAIDGSMPGQLQGMPKGPVPSRAKMSGMGRRARRANERKGQ
ncbi:MAG: DUF4191 domain-containing protein [Corynebacterium sp.]|nr:DUF4191 domain-containing protein [Corynebacterium sp.]